MLLFKDHWRKAVTLPPSPSFLPPTRSFSRCLLATQTVIYLYQSVSRRWAVQITQVILFFCLWADVAFSLSKLPLTPCVTNRACLKYYISGFRQLSLCVIEQHQDSWASLVASDWASGLICIIRFSQLWNSFDLPPSLVTEWDRVSLLLPPPHTHPPFSSITLTPSLSSMSIISSPDTQIHPSLTLWSYYAALHLSISISSLQFPFITLLFCTCLICGGISSRRQPSWF